MTEPIKCQAAPSQLRFERVTVDPELAQKWLDTRHLNVRYTRKRKVLQYGTDMLANAWRENSEVIKIGTDGQLLDGQHRLHAIIDNNIEIKLWVAFDVPLEAMSTIDTGSSRNLADVLRLAGEDNAGYMAGVVRKWCYWQQGLRYWVKNPAGKQSISVPVMAQAFRQMPDEFRFATRMGMDIYAHTQMLGRASAGFLFLLTAQIDYDQAMEFKDRLIDGQNLTEGNPIAVLRKKLFSIEANKLSDIERLAVAINAWNLWRDERTVEFLGKVYSSNGRLSKLPLSDATFPVPR
jgi:hypothetical protein